MRLRWFAFPVLALAGMGVVSLALLGFVILLAYPNLPSIEALTEYQPKIPLRVYTADGLLIGEFGEERRSVVSIEEVPSLMKQAILAAEDERFYQHTGVDYHGVLRAAYSNLVSGGKTQGASTITMQVARNFFLSREKKSSARPDRKSTRLNSSHANISYAVFCLKKKKKITNRQHINEL